VATNHEHGPFAWAGRGGQRVVPYIARYSTLLDAHNRPFELGERPDHLHHHPARSMKRVWLTPLFPIHVGGFVDHVNHGRLVDIIGPILEYRPQDRP
jgi:hypothetical protein